MKIISKYNISTFLALNNQIYSSFGQGLLFLCTMNFYQFYKNEIFCDGYSPFKWLYNTNFKTNFLKGLMTRNIYYSHTKRNDVILNFLKQKCFWLHCLNTFFCSIKTLHTSKGLEQQLYWKRKVIPGFLFYRS